MKWKPSWEESKKKLPVEIYYEKERQTKMLKWSVYLPFEDPTGIRFLLAEYSKI